MGLYSKQEFCQGMATLGVDSINGLKRKLDELKNELNDNRKFKETYRFVFNFARDPGSRNVAVDTAISLWRLLLAPKYQLSERWILFLEENGKRHDVSKDTWNMLLDFLEEIGGDVYNFEEDGPWPVIIDEFVAWEKEKRN